MFGIGTWMGPKKSIYLLYLLHLWKIGLLHNARLNYNHKKNPKCHSSKTFFCHKAQNCAYNQEKYFPNLSQHENLDQALCGSGSLQVTEVKFLGKGF